MKYRIPEEYINKKDVIVVISDKNNSINIGFSQRLNDVFNKWPSGKVNDIISDIKTDLSWSLMYTPIQIDTPEYIYDRIFVTLMQVY